jgi:succinate dehydrogenase (ubiquinone) cytochrome b560 subunit
MQEVERSRPVSTQSMSEADNLAYLNEQRAKRPSSPWHIYQPQLTSMSSIANRATGAGLSVGEFRFSPLSTSDLKFR